MAHNSRIRLPGFWTAGSVILPAEMEALDLAQYEEINGDLGGTWAPTSQILIGGSGVRVSGPFIANSVTSMTVTGTETINPFAFFVADTASFVVLGGLVSLTGTMETLGSGQIQVSNVKGIEVLSGGEIDIDSGGAWRLKGGAVGYMDAGSAIDMTGTGLFAAASINVGAYGYVNFTGANSFATWSSGSKGWFFAGSTLELDGFVRFTAGSDTQISGTSGSPATWEWGGNTIQTIALGAQFTDAGTHDNTGPWTFSNNVTFDSSSTVLFQNNATFGASSNLVINMAAKLGMAQPAKTDPTGTNVLLSTLQVKAWCTIALNNGNDPVITDGCNVTNVTFTAGIQANQNLLVFFGTPFANTTYAVDGTFVTPAGPLFVTGVAFMLAPPQKGECGVTFGQVLGGNLPEELNMSEQTGTVMLFFYGRQ